MPIAIGAGSGASGDIVPYLKYDARAGRMSVRTDDGGSRPVSEGVIGLCDLAQILTGWVTFGEGVAPDFRADPSLQEALPRPTDKHNRGFRVLWFSPKNLGGLREMMGSSRAINEAITDLYNTAEAAPEWSQGKVPVVKWTGIVEQVSTIRATGGKSTNYKPLFAIDRWVDRPAELPLRVTQAAQAATTQKQAPPPVEDGDTEF